MQHVPNPIINLDNLTKQYNKKKVINSISLEIPKGCLGLLGPNGAGKTTTINMLMSNLAII
jgi:ABC-type multidrug transport system ATPase subunit